MPYCSLWQYVVISPMAKKVTTTVYITEQQQELLRTLNKRTKVPVAEYIRQGIDLIIENHKQDLPGQLAFGSLPRQVATPKGQ